MDAAALRVSQRLVAAVHVSELGPRKPGDHRTLHGAGDCLDRLELTLARDWEARLDVVDAEAR